MSAKRSRSSHSTPSQVLTPIAARTASSASQASISRASAVRFGPADRDGRGSASRTRTRSATAHASPSSRPAVAEPGRERRRAAAARRTRPGWSRRRPRPAPARRSVTARASRAASPDRPAGVGAAHAEAAVPSARGPSRHDDGVAGHAGRRRRSRPGTSRTASRGRRGPRVRSARPAPPRTRSPSKIARSGTWTGSSWSSRIASSSDGTPRPPSVAASRAHWPARPVVDLAELPEDVALVGVQRDPQAALPDLAARAERTRARSGRRGTTTNAPASFGSPGRRRASADRAACAPSGVLRAYGAESRIVPGRRPEPVVDRARATASDRSRSNRRGRARRRRRRR